MGIRPTVAVIAGLMAASACGSGAQQQGDLGAHCYPNGTCNVTLTCEGGLCVATPADAAVGADVGPGDGAFLDGPVDATPDSRADASFDAHVDAPPDAYCEALQTPNGDGHHNAGTSCIVAGCHLTGNTGAAAPAFTYAGTIYRDTAGTQAYAGATVAITLGGVTKKAVSGSNGNFYLTSASLASPTNTATATALASVCPTVVYMSGALTQGGGNCNNCHKTGGLTTPVYAQ